MILKKKRDLNKVMRLQTDSEFQQNDIKKLNKKYNVQVLSTRLRGEKAFAAKQKSRELKKLLLKGKNLSKKKKIKIKPNKIIEHATKNMNKTKSYKYDIDPNTIEKNVSKTKTIEKYVIFID